MAPPHPIPAARRRCGLAARHGLYTALGVFGLAIALVVYLEYAEGRRRSARFTVDAQRVLDTASMGGGASGESERALRLVLEVETHRGTFTHAVIGAGPRIIVAGDASQVGLDGAFALARPGLGAYVATLPPDGTVRVQRLDDPRRLEGVAVIGRTETGAPIWMYMGLDLAAASASARQRMATMLACAAVLALFAGGLVWVLLRRSVTTPLRVLAERVERHGLTDIVTQTADLGAFDPLAKVLETASTRLLEDGAAGQVVLRGRLTRATEYATAQGDFIEVLLHDLRRSMAAVMGHAELLVEGDLRAGDRVNCIRAIQAEARRISRVAHDIRTVLPRADEVLESADADWPAAALREILDTLDAASSVLKISGGTTALPRDKADEAGVAPAVIRHMRGAVLMVGRVDPGTHIVRALENTGLRVVAVDDLDAAGTALADPFDVVIVCLAGLDVEPGEVVPRLRHHHDTVPVVGVLPRTARAHGEALKHLGFATYLYEPLSRSGVLAGLGSFFGFSAV